MEEVVGQEQTQAPPPAGGSVSEDVPSANGGMETEELDRDLSLDEEAAAIVIGKYAKGYITRKEVEQIKRNREEEMIREIEEKAAVRIGAAAKGRIQRKKFEQMKSEQSGRKPLPLDFEMALSKKFAINKIESMSGLKVVDNLGGDSDVVATKLRVKAEVEAWSGEQCSEFLTSVTAMRPYSEAFCAINGSAMLRMSINSLSSIGIKQFDHQRIIWAAVKELQQFCNNIEYIPADESI